MNKSIIWIVIVAVLILGAVYFLGNKPAGENAENMEASAAMSLRELMQEGGTQRCEFADSTEMGSTSGVVYFDNGKMRGDFNIETPSAAFASHMIVLGEDVYVWEDMLGQGFKMKVSGMTEASSTNENSPDLDKKVDYRCEDWSADPAQFEIPERDFMDVSAMMQGAVNGNDINAIIEAAGKI